VMRLGTGILCLCCSLVHAGKPLFDMDAIKDASTLKAEVLEDWHPVDGEVKTRQKLITISVGELWPGQDLRAPVRMIVPADCKAEGFHLTGGHQTKQLQKDARPRGIEVELLKGGVGLVYTVVQTLESQGQHELAKAMDERFLKTLNPHYSIQYWGWPATLMRATTAAYAETDYFTPGKVALSGGSKNGASPSVALIHDQRMTAQHGTVSPLWESPLRLCDRTAWDELHAFNEQDGVQRPHAFLGGTYGPIYNRSALSAGRSWEELQQLALDMEDQVFISKNMDALKARGVELLFEPGSHDFVCYDIAWGGAHYPQIPVYYRANSGHGKKKPHPQAEKRVRNRDALFLNHFFGGNEALLESPAVKTLVKGKTLQVTVQFPAGSIAESGRIFWIFDRAPDGSDAYLRKLIPDENSAEMKFDAMKNSWSVEIPLIAGAEHVDFFSNHRKVIRYSSDDLSTYISCPYTRLELK